MRKCDDFMPPRVGSKEKINIYANIGSGLHLSDVDFKVSLFTKSNFAKSNNIDYNKEDLIKVDDDNYLAPLDTEILGPGEYMVRLHVYVPDADFENGIRDEIVVFPTGLVVTR